MTIPRTLRMLLGVTALLALTGLALAGPDEQKPAQPYILVQVDDDLLQFRVKHQENWTNLFFDTLYQWVPGPQGAELKPCIADGWPEWSDDKLICTIKLRTDAVFDDFAGFPDGKGRRVEALDAINSIKWLAKGRHKDKLASDILLRGRIAGLDDFAAKAGITREWTYEDRSTEVAGLTAKDQYTLQVTLTRPCGQLPALLATPWLPIWPLEVLDVPRDKRDRNKPFAGTGPMQPVEFDSGWPNMVPRKSHFADPKSPPPLKRVFGSTRSVVDALREMGGAKLDFWIVPDDQLFATNQLRGEHDTIHFGDQEALHYLGFNMQRATWGGDSDDSLALRKAVCDLIDREAIAHETMKTEPWRATRGLLPPIHGVTAPKEAELASARSVDAIKQELHNNKFRHDPDKNGNVFTLEVVCADPSFDPKTLKHIEAPLSQAGIAVNWRPLGQQAFEDAMREGSYDAVFFGWSNDWADPLCMLERLHSRNAQAHWVLSVPCRYKNDSFDKLIEKAESIALDPGRAGERNKAIGECLRHLAKDLPYVPIAVPQRAWLAQPDIDVPQVPVSGRNTLRFLKFK
ncbi:MAG: ABC transporter substrate-binding protein [Planctomycetes bacterium]|nr:ABC transporter substrate-binding protein [Planctomycetota bacterium]